MATCACRAINQFFARSRLRFPVVAHGDDVERSGEMGWRGALFVISCFVLLSGCGGDGRPDRLSDIEMQAVQDVFRSGISAGARQGDLKARGLIH